MGGGEFPRIPDWKQYKVEGIPSLEWTQKSLAARGLKDPWLRNEVWRYQQWPGFGRSAWITVSRGFKWAFLAFAVTLAADKAYGLGHSQQGHDDHH